MAQQDLPDLHRLENTFNSLDQVRPDACISVVRSITPHIRLAFRWGGSSHRGNAPDHSLTQCSTPSQSVAGATESLEEALKIVQGDLNNSAPQAGCPHLETVVYPRPRCAARQWMRARQERMRLNLCAKYCERFFPIRKYIKTGEHHDSQARRSSGSREDTGDNAGSR